MADVSSVYRKVWSNPEARAAADAASNAYSAAAAQSGESSCFRSGITYGASGAAESLGSFATFRKCGKDFGKEVAKPSKK